MNKITVAQKFAATIAILKGETPEIEFSTADAVAFMEDRAEKAKSKRKSGPRAPKPETVEFRNKVKDFMEFQTEPVVAKTVAEELNVSTQKASAALRFLTAEGILEVVEGGKVKQYVKA